jgi:pimeloyl-ACP methyl ester carboxylesterase
MSIHIRWLAKPVFVFVESPFWNVPEPMKRFLPSGLHLRLLHPGWCLAIGLVLAGWGTGCRAPIGADRTSTRMAYKALTESAIKRELSDASRLVLHRYDLTHAFARDPEAVLKQLHELAIEDTRRDLLFALAELNYLRGEQLQRSVKPWEPRQAADFFLASAIYSWFYLLGDGEEPPPSAYDRRFRVSCDLYNRAVARAFATGDPTNTVIRIRSCVRNLPGGRVSIEVITPDFEWDVSTIREFLPADEFTVRGLTVRDRQSGLGAPLIALQRGDQGEGFLRPVPTTLFLRVPGDLRTWSEQGLEPTLELFSTYEVSQVRVGDQIIPLEGDTTAPLAYSLNDDFIWDLGLIQFFSAEERIPSDIYFTQPYTRGRIPVIFVHGTFSSPVWWAEMWNTLRNDAVLRERYQFWYFIYNSGNPIVYSAAQLRQSIESALHKLDPDGQDAALQQMVVIGHSQGGLLTKLTATDTGDRLWRVYFDTDLDDMDLDPEVRERIRQYAFFDALPSVRRVVFISTPHRGSFLANNLVRQLSRRFMSLPGDLLSVTEVLLPLRQQSDIPAEVRRAVPTSLDQMSPKNRMLLTLAEIPVAPQVTAHSIIPVKGNGPPEEGDDGVVKYTSAHVDYVESELIVPSGHGCQGTPQAIEEVRRILLEHLEAVDASQVQE